MKDWNRTGKEAVIGRKTNQARNRLLRVDLGLWIFGMITLVTLGAFTRQTYGGLNPGPDLVCNVLLMLFKLEKYYRDCNICQGSLTPGPDLACNAQAVLPGLINNIEIVIFAKEVAPGQAGRALVHYD